MGLIGRKQETATIPSPGKKEKKKTRDKLNKYLSGVQDNTKQVVVVVALSQSTTLRL